MVASGRTATSLPVQFLALYDENSPLVVTTASWGLVQPSLWPFQEILCWGNGIKHSRKLIRQDQAAAIGKVLLNFSDQILMTVYLLSIFQVY